METVITFTVNVMETYFQSVIEVPLLDCLLQALLINAIGCIILVMNPPNTMADIN